MTTLTVTIPAGDNPGSRLRRLAKQIEKVASEVADGTATGTSTVLTIDNAPTTGLVSVQITAGPYSAGKKRVA